VAFNLQVNAQKDDMKFWHDIQDHMKAENSDSSAAGHAVTCSSYVSCFVKFKGSFLGFS
jgi:hypothetical protein